jgi:hypothetical protein
LPTDNKWASHAATRALAHPFGGNFPFGILDVSRDRFDGGIIRIDLRKH